MRFDFLKMLQIKKKIAKIQHNDTLKKAQFGVIESDEHSN